MAVKQATLFNPTTGARKVVDVGDPNAFAGGFVLETPTDNYQTRTMAAFDVTKQPGIGQTPSGLTPLNAPPANPVTPTPSPVVNSAPAATAPTSNGVNTPTGSNSAFQAAFGQLMAKGKQDQALQDQKNLLIKQIYDTPLTPDQLRTLSPAQQEAIRNGDKGLIEFQILTLNDMIKGRADENTTALQYMMDGYKLDQEAANTKKQSAFSSFSNMIAKYPNLAGKMSDAGWLAFQQGEMPPPADLMAVYGEYKNVVDTDDLLSVTEAANLGVPYGTTKTAAATMGKNPKETLTGQDKIDTELKLANVYDKNASELRTVRNNTAVMETAYQEGTRRMAAGESVNAATQAMVTAFGKILDPNSVVRESEYARSAIGQSFLNQMQGTWEKLLQGGAGLTQETLDEFMQMGRQFMEGYRDSLQGTLSRLETQADNYGLNIENIVPADEWDGYLKRKQKDTMTPEQKTQFDTFRNDPRYKELSDEDIIEAMGLTSVGSVTQNAQKLAADLTSIPTNVKWGEGKRTTNVGQCGALVNDITGVKLGDSLESKVKVCDPKITPETVAVGDVFVQSTSTPYGHTGIINALGEDDKGKFAIVTEANWKLNGQTTHDRKVYLDSPAIKGFAKPKTWNLA